MFKLLSTNAITPTRGTKKSAGYDLYASEEVTVSHHMGVTPVPIDISFECPAGTYGRLAIRSSLAFKQHLVIDAGVIDEDYYPNPVKVLLHCCKPGHSYTIQKGEKFAQVIFEKYYTLGDDVVTDRNGGFGSTNVNVAVTALSAPVLPLPYVVSTYDSEKPRYFAKGIKGMPDVKDESDSEDHEDMVF